MTHCFFCFSPVLHTLGSPFHWTLLSPVETPGKAIILLPPASLLDQQSNFLVLQKSRCRQESTLNFRFCLNVLFSFCLLCRSVSIKKWACFLSLSKTFEEILCGIYEPYKERRVVSAQFVGWCQTKKQKQSMLFGCSLVDSQANPIFFPELKNKIRRKYMYCKSLWIKFCYVW